jgi:glycosyltransferase involved in cell wall biosynthesis
VGPSSSNPTVSVIIPAFNTAAFVGAAIKSAVLQEAVDVEVVVIDDGSTDETTSIVEDWSRRDERVRVFKNVRSGGSSAARNIGLRAARGRFVAFLDSDDSWLPRFLVTQLEAFADFPDAGVVTANAMSVGGPMDGMLIRPAASPRRRITLTDMVEKEDAVNIMSVFRRDVYDAIGGFDATLRRSEDYDFWLRAAIAGFVFVQTAEPLVLYRRRAGSLSSDELKMLTAMGEVLSLARTRCEDRPSVCAAIDAKLADLERRSIALRATTALRAREFGRAAEDFQHLYEHDRRVSRAILAAASRFAPWTLWWADRLRRSVRA